MRGRFENPAKAFALVATMFAVFATGGTAAAASSKAEMTIGDQPGYVPTPEEEKVAPQYRPQPVFFRTSQPPGTIVIYTNERFLYLVQGGGRAIRYGIGVGREGFIWQGLQKISRKQEWPDWRPPPEMIKRQPYLPRHMKGGPGNPLGARAMYIGPTIYRIHGTHDPDSVGEADSSGCIRLTNPDVIDLYERVKVGAKVIVVQ